MSRERRAEIAWVVGAADERRLKRDGFHVVPFTSIRSRFIEPARDPNRAPGLENVAQPLFRIFEDHERVAVTGVPTRDNGDIRDLFGYLVEPAWRRGTELRIFADRALDDLRPEELIEPQYGHAWTLERLHFVLARAHRSELEPGLPALTPIEHRLLLAMRASGLSPIAQYGVGRFRVDFAFPDVQLAVEADGREWHNPQRDRRRDDELSRQGWSVRRFTGSEIVADADRCAAAIVAALAELRPRLSYTPLEQEPPDLTPLHRFLEWLRRLVRREQERGDDVHADDEVVAGPPPSWRADLDHGQVAAVGAHGGVVQVLAPAGSGKTTVLIARVQELISRGVPANRILCCTFNRAAKDELISRLRRVGADAVVAKNFHGLGYSILEQHGLLRSDIHQITYAQWRYLSREAQRAVDDGEGVWLDADVAAEAISRFKLVDLVTPAEARAALETKSEATAHEVTAVELYGLYENLLERDDVLDFDDLILRSVRLLREDEQARREWQQRFVSVLVDEYQDIEPAQELLVQLVAAPHNSLFCVGDEDQCLYAWRRASVERIIELDRTYPGLERHALGVNYRCPRDVTRASRFLIENNVRRFPKTIEAHPNARDGTVEIAEFGPEASQTAYAAQRLRAADPAQTVLLARTRQLLREAALECARHGVHFKAGDFILDRTGPNRTLFAYLSFFADLCAATPDDVKRVFRIPNRYLPDRAADALATHLRRGATFAEAVAGLTGDNWRQDALEAGAAFFDRLAVISNAREFIAALRSEGGLDAHYTAEQKLNVHDQSSVDALEAAERKAAGHTVRSYAAAFAAETDLITRFRSDKGVELTTIHGAKGREWPWVILLGAEHDVLPHRKTLETASDRPTAIEDERRLAYVALTRSKQRLTILHGEAKSPFLVEAEAGFAAPARVRLGFAEPEPTRSPAANGAPAPSPRPLAAGQATGD